MFITPNLFFYKHYFSHVNTVFRMHLLNSTMITWVTSITIESASLHFKSSSVIFKRYTYEFRMEQDKQAISCYEIGNEGL